MRLKIEELGQGVFQWINIETQNVLDRPYVKLAINSAVGKKSTCQLLYIVIRGKKLRCSHPREV